MKKIYKLCFSCFIMSVLIFSPALSSVFAEDYLLYFKGKNVYDSIDFSLYELKNLPSDVISESVYIPKGFGGKKIMVKGVKLAYLLEKKCGVKVKDCDVLFFASNDKAYSTQSYSDILDSKHGYLVALELDGVPVDLYNRESGFQIYKHKDGLFQQDIVFKSVKSIKLPAEFSHASKSFYNVFTDISSKYKYSEEAINYMASNNIINGMNDGEFDPGAKITRAQLSKLIIEALNFGKTDYTGDFSDVSHSSWYAEYVSSVVKYGLFTGYEDGSFRPEKGINRQELVAVAVRLALKESLVTREELKKYDIQNTDFIDKGSIGGWAGSAVAWLESQDVLSAFVGSRFEPLREANRAEATYLIYKILFDL